MATDDILSAYAFPVLSVKSKKTWAAITAAFALDHQIFSSEE